MYSLSNKHVEKAKAPQKTRGRQIEYRANIKHFDPKPTFCRPSNEIPHSKYRRGCNAFLSMNAGREVSCSDRLQRVEKPRSQIYGDAQIKNRENASCSIWKGTVAMQEENKDRRSPQMYKIGWVVKYDPRSYDRHHMHPLPQASGRRGINRTTESRVIAVAAR